MAALFEGRNAEKNRETVLNGGLSSIELLRQSAAGLDYLHGYDFIHRNIHPRNVLIAEIGGDNQPKRRYMVKLSDFRRGKKLESQGTAGNSMTRGETNWIAPEMADSEAFLTSAVASGAFEWCLQAFPSLNPSLLFVSAPQPSLPQTTSS